MTRPIDPQTQQQVDRLRRETKLSLRDIAKASGLSVPTVRKIIKNGVDTLHKNLVR
jgi:DNA invertase Pin-like site-specific DNA recombinase